MTNHHSGATSHNWPQRGNTDTVDHNGPQIDQNGATSWPERTITMEKMM